MSCKQGIGTLIDDVLKKTYAKPKVTTVQFSRQHVSTDSAGTFVTLDHALFNEVWLVLTPYKKNHPQRLSNYADVHVFSLDVQILRDCDLHPLSMFAT